MVNQIARTEGNRNIIVQAEGASHTINVYGHPYLTLVPVQRRLRPHLQKDIQLLDPAYQAVPLTGRDQDLHDLQQWLGTAKTVSVHTLTGQAGAGKTRLALELMLALDTERPWHAGFLTAGEARRFLQSQNLSDWGWQKPTLIVVDYASTVAPLLAQWFRELADSRAVVEPDPQQPPLLLLLLERYASTGSGWYQSLVSGDWQSESVRSLFDPWEPLQLSRLDQISARRLILQNAPDRAAQVRGKQVPALPPLGAQPLFGHRLGQP